LLLCEAKAFAFAFFFAGSSSPELRVIPVTLLAGFSMANSGLGEQYTGG
jgi:hypothetical protein